MAADDRPSGEIGVQSSILRNTLMRGYGVQGVKILERENDSEPSSLRDMVEKDLSRGKACQGFPMQDHEILAKLEGGAINQFGRLNTSERLSSTNVNLAAQKCTVNRLRGRLENR